jgi:hypothetical protein
MTPRPRKRPAEDAMAPTSYRSPELIETLPRIRWNQCCCWDSPRDLIFESHTAHAEGDWSEPGLVFGRVCPNEPTWPPSEQKS